MKKILFITASIICLISKQAFAQPANDDCSTAQNIGTLPPAPACVGTALSVGATVNIAGTLVGATPANPYLSQPACSGAGGPNMGVPANDVWYTFTASGYQAIISVTSTFANPNIAMYSGTCGALGGGVGGCAVGTGGNVTLTVDQMVPGTTYYLQVTGNTGQTGTFNMAIHNNQDCNNCLVGSTTTVAPLPVNGMYNPGQTVNFCFHVSNYAQINTNWLHGVQLTFGAGWNLASLTTTSPPACETAPAGGTWAYYPGGCTSSATGAVFGPGFYFDTPDAGTNPGNNFGDNCSGAQGGGTWNFCFSITVAPGCSPGSNLNVTINTSGDGESGSWSNAGCAGDPATVLPAVGSCCPPTMSSTPSGCAGPTGTATATPVGASGPYTYVWTNAGGTVVSTSTGVAGANTAVGLPAGTYTVSLTNALNCLITNTVVVGGPAPIATPTAGSNSPICLGGTLNLTAAVVAGATYGWTGPNGFISGIQNPSIAGVTAAAAGIYTVTATVGGCTSTSTVNVVISPVPTVNVPPNITVCNGGAVPATNFTSVPAGATYTWTNSNPAIGIGAGGIGNVPAFTGTNLTAAAITGTITVTPTLAGCPGTPNTYTITINPTPTVTVPANITVCNGGNVPATAYVSSPVGGTFAWTNSNPAIGLAANGAGNTPSFNAVNAGAAPITATITVTPTVNGCPGTPNTYTITINPTPTVIVPANITVCDGSNIATSVFASVPAGGTFTWTNSNTAIGLAAAGIGNTPAFAATNAGAAAITATITVTPTVAGCPGTPNTYTITVNPTPPAPTALGATICTNTSATLTATAPGGIYTWYDAPVAGTLLITNPSYTTPNLTTNTTYYVQTTILGCTGPFTPVTVTIAPGLIVNAGSDDTVCFGISTTLNVIPNGAGYTYAWTPAGSLSNAAIFNPVASPAATTNYAVTVTDPAGCVGTDNVTIYADPQITMAIAGINVTCNGACNGQTIVIPAGGTPAYTYSWNGGCNNAACNSLCPGTYTVTVTDSWGCTGTANTTVTEPTLLTASNTGPAQTSCNGVCDATVTASGAGGSPGYSYSWNTVPVQNTATVAGLCAGIYTCTVSDANGCTANTIATVTEPSLVVIAPIVSPTICFGGTTNIVASASGGNGGPYVYSWSPPAGLDFTNIPNPNASPVGTTVYTVNANDANGCPAAAVNVTVTVNPPLTVVANGTTSICPGASTPISAVAANGTGGPYTYSWSPAAGLSNPLIANPSASPAVTTVYTVTANDGCSPSVTATVTITVLPVPAVAFVANITSGCSPLCVNFTDNSTVTGGVIATWDWNFGDGGPDSTSQNPSHCFYATGSYSITLTVTSSLGGCTSTNTMTNYITVNPDPIAEFSATPNPATILDPSVTFNNQSSPDVNYWFWSFGDGDTLGYTTSDPTHMYPNIIASTYNAQLTVHNIYGCVSTVIHPIIIGPEFTFFIPNAFSPNGDGINDNFFGQGVGIAKYELYVFDRWGNLIFYADDLNKFWDGKANHGSDMAQQDVYVWKVKLTDVFDKKHNYIGTVTIVK